MLVTLQMPILKTNDILTSNELDTVCRPVSLRDDEALWIVEYCSVVYSTQRKLKVGSSERKPPQSTSGQAMNRLAV